MKNALHKKIWRTGAVQINVDPHPIPLIKSNNDKNQKSIGLNLNYVEILHQKSRIFTSLNGLV